MNYHDGRWGHRKYPWKEYPVEVNAFVRMQNRVLIRKTTTSVWPRTTDGFFAFLKYIGRCPKRLTKPSLGRRDHSKGYQPGNVFWQEWRENNLEGCQMGGAVTAAKTRGKRRPFKQRQKMSLVALSGQPNKNRIRAGQLSGVARRRKARQKRLGP